MISIRPGTATLAEVEEVLIRYTLAAVGGSKAKAAKVLGVSRRTIYNKLASYEWAAELVREMRFYRRKAAR